jgi:hypothetical protein
MGFRFGRSAALVLPAVSRLLPGLSACLRTAAWRQSPELGEAPIKARRREVLRSACTATRPILSLYSWFASAASHVKSTIRIFQKIVCDQKGRSQSSSDFARIAISAAGEQDFEKRFSL